jgi:hypothetical protein
MSLLDKESLLPVRVEGRRRSSRLTNESESVQLQSATLEVEDSEGEVHHLIQIKWWTKRRKWSMQIFDADHNLIALAGPRTQEIACWEECIRVMEAKGLWAAD